MLNSVPYFPSFSKLQIEYKDEIIKYTNNFPPYSDFNFSSLWSYNIYEDIQVSNLNNNLIFLLRDYLSNLRFFTFLGSLKIEDTLNKIISLSNHVQVEAHIKLFPKTNFFNNYSIFNRFSIINDRDNYDYILSAKEISELKAFKYEEKRWHISIFKKAYPQYSVRVVNLSDKSFYNDLEYIYDNWKKRKNDPEEEKEYEYKAFHRLLKIASLLKHIALIIYVKNVPIGFLMADLSYPNYAIGSFMKGDAEYKGIYEIMYNEFANFLLNKNINYINAEQDLGLIGLRESKENWHPIFYLEKFTIRI